MPRLLDSNESRARDSEEDLFKESRLELLRGRDLFRDSLFVSLLFPFPLLLPAPPPPLLLLLLLLLLLVRLLLPSESRFESRAFDRDLPQWLSRLESRGGLINDFNDSLLSFLPWLGGLGAVAFAVAPGKGIRLGRRRGDGFTSTA